MKKQVLVSAIAAAVAASAFVPAAQAAELSASAGVSNFYLWRGQDLSNGSPAISGDLSISEGPVYGGVWASSGDDSFGQEFDLYVGVGQSFGDFAVDLSYWTYSYPDTAIGTDVGPGEIADVIGSVSYGPVTASAYYAVGDNDGVENDFTYFTLSGGYMDYSATLGYYTDADFNGDFAEYTYLDLGYSYNDSLGFTLTLPLTPEESSGQDPMVNVSYSLPIDL